jgi:MerR family transcriptional regulator, heat shock protein HspR
MSVPRDQLVLRRIEREQITLDMLAASAGLHPALVECFVEFGLIEPVERVGGQQLFDVSCITRLRTIVRLRRDVGINLSGIAVILDMLDRLTALQRENAWLRNRR